MTAKTIILCVDGHSDKGEIYNAVRSAAQSKGLRLRKLGSSNSPNYAEAKSNIDAIPDGEPVNYYTPIIDSLVSANGGQRSNLKLLIVGKSYGGAKMYRYLYEFSATLNDFDKLAIVLVDPHEPWLPTFVGAGDDGDCGKWYFYVYFEHSSYNLKWWPSWNSRFQLESSADQADINSKLRVYSIFQRNKWPRGYKLDVAYNNHRPPLKFSLTNCDVTSYVGGSSGAIEDASHFNIDNCDKTIELLEDAIAYLNYFPPIVRIHTIEKTESHYEGGHRIDLVNITFSWDCPNYDDNPLYTLYLDNIPYPQFTERTLPEYSGELTITLPINFDQSVNEVQRHVIKIVAPAKWPSIGSDEKSVSLYPAKFTPISYIEAQPETTSFNPPYDGYSILPNNTEWGGLLPWNLSVEHIEIKEDISNPDDHSIPEGAVLTFDADDFFENRPRPEHDRISVFLMHQTNYWYYLGYIGAPILCRLFLNNGWVSPIICSASIERTQDNGVKEKTLNIPDESISNGFALFGEGGIEERYYNDTYETPTSDNITIELSDVAGQKYTVSHTFHGKYLIIVSKTYQIAEPPIFDTLKDRVLGVWCDPQSPLIREILTKIQHLRAKGILHSHSDFSRFQNSSKIFVKRELDRIFGSKELQGRLLSLCEREQEQAKELAWKLISTKSSSNEFEKKLRGLEQARMQVIYARIIPEVQKKLFERISNNFDQLSR